MMATPRKNIKSRPCAFRRVALAALLLSVAGCGSGVPLGKVSGHVTKNGKPQPDLMVKFEPVDGGRGSRGKTDANGTYELIFTERNGALLGKHHVTIEIPEKYDNAMVVVSPAQKFLTTEREVGSGSNVFDFELSEAK